MPAVAEDAGLSSPGLERARAHVAACVERGEIGGAVVVVSRHDQVAQMTCFGLRDIEAALPMTRTRSSASAFDDEADHQRRRDAAGRSRQAAARRPGLALHRGVRRPGGLRGRRRRTRGARAARPAYHDPRPVHPHVGHRLRRPGPGARGRLRQPRRHALRIGRVHAAPRRAPALASAGGRLAVWLVVGRPRPGARGRLGSAARRSTSRPRSSTPLGMVDTGYWVPPGKVRRLAARTRRRRVCSSGWTTRTLATSRGAARS